MNLAARAQTSTHVLGMARICLRVQHSFAWIRALWPRDFLFSSSMVRLLNYGQSSVLLEGDGERAIERRIAVPYHPNADLRQCCSRHTRDGELRVKSPLSTIPGWVPQLVGPVQNASPEAARGFRSYVDRTDVKRAVTFYLDGHSVTPWLAALH
jgi:hypothetical protein